MNSENTAQDQSKFSQYLQSLHSRYQGVIEGSVPDYIPELALANPHWFGISIE